MCGIVGYIGTKAATSVLLKGLKCLEYRGYDSSGIALLNDSLFVCKKKGKIIELEKELNGLSKDLSTYTVGIAHTRWATHGEPSDLNAHPHVSSSGKIAVVHNGIIENFQILREKLALKGFKITTQTDSEIIAHLIEYYVDKYNDFLTGVFVALEKLEGTYGIVVVSRDYPDRIIAARNGSPLILGVGEGEIIIASDASAIVEYTRKVIYIDDREVVDIQRDSYQTYDLLQKQVEKPVEDIDWDIETIGKKGYDHFMLKEIFEQVESVKNTCRGRLLTETGTSRLDGLNLKPEDFSEIKRIILIACGTSWHSALIGEYLIEEYARIPVDVEYASEFRYKNPILTKSDLVIVISQSGETADTLAALREAKQKGVKVLGVTNIVGSTIARESDGGVYLHAGPEIGVASTKAFSSQVMVMIMIAIHFARRKDMSLESGQVLIEKIEKLPQLIQSMLDTAGDIKNIAEIYKNASNFLYLGRGVQFPVALEGALKLKEISYIHAEGYPAAEMKHGPIALIDENLPVVFIALKDSIYGKIVSNMQEVRARGGKIIAIATEGDNEISNYADHVIFVPDVDRMLSPILTVVPLQLLSYYIAVMRGCNVDQPRNLAKSVTVE
ncbi:MAG: glutamine--fructose-6-phosphate transaminase (isomerizing) [Spirochaetes bacterium]|nr:glutamine--fructose-6-phosphate transaminase (isomerizing) [Spirochaetota bacterium]MBN2770487.1 glutamine--fructose-6-phosphate transaminase (isomerizing) [Spirochaetota bacterium]